MKSSGTSLGKIFKRVLDVLIVAYAIMIPVVIATGGFQVDVLGVSIKVTHVYTPIAYLIPLGLIRLFITVELANFLLVVGSVLFALLLMEITIWVWNPPIGNPMTQLHRPSAELGWELVPRASGYGALGEYYHVNSAGLRGEEHSREKKPGVYRVAVLGDSFTFGMGVNLEDTYPKRIEKLLQQVNPDLEVINFGVIGHNMWQHYEMLRHKVLGYQPDLVVLGLFAGDDFYYSVPLYDASGRFAGEFPFPPFEKEPGLWAPMSYFAFWNLLRNVNLQFEYKYRYRRGYKYVKGIEERKKKYGPLRPDHIFSKTMAGNMGKQKSLEFSEALEKFVRAGNNAGAKTLVVLIPDSVQLNDSYMQGINRFAEQVCAKIKVPFLDMTPILEAEEDHTSLYLFPFDAHNSPRGLRVIAKAIADRIVELGLLREKRIGSQVSSRAPLFDWHDGRSAIRGAGHVQRDGNQLGRCGKEIRML